MSCALGCLVAGLFANLPFIVAPPTAVSIFYSVYIQQNEISMDTGSTAVIICGISLIFMGYGPIGSFITMVD